MTSDLDLDLPESADSDDLSELDDLLGESLTIAAARKAAKSGKKDVSSDLIDIAQAADAALQWEPTTAIARFIEQHCDCGATHTRFDSWFILSQHRRIADGRRWKRTDSHEGLPATQYTVREDVTYCADCVSNDEYPLATEENCPGISCLGEAAAQCLCPEEIDQLPLPFDEAQLDEIAAEMDEILDTEDKAIWEEIENA